MSTRVIGSSFGIDVATISSMRMTTWVPPRHRFWYVQRKYSQPSRGIVRKAGNFFQHNDCYHLFQVLPSTPCTVWPHSYAADLRDFVPSRTELNGGKLALVWFVKYLTFLSNTHLEHIVPLLVIFLRLKIQCLSWYGLSIAMFLKRMRKRDTPAPTQRRFPILLHISMILKSLCGLSRQLGW